MPERIAWARMFLLPRPTQLPTPSPWLMMPSHAMASRVIPLWLMYSRIAPPPWTLLLSARFPTALVPTENLRTAWPSKHLQPTLGPMTSRLEHRQKKSPFASTHKNAGNRSSVNYTHLHAQIVGAGAIALPILFDRRYPRAAYAWMCILWVAAHKIYSHVSNRGASGVRSPLDR
jgi:hypothetical protein